MAMTINFQEENNQMRPLKLILSLFILLIISQNSIYACSCSHYEAVFCRNVHEGHKIVRGVVTDQPDVHLMEFSILENINNEIVEDTILVLGQDGVNCGEYLEQFAVNDTLILALNTWEINGTEFWHLMGLCGLHFLRFENGLVSGQITDDFTSQDLQGFKDNLLSCIDMEVPVLEVDKNELEINVFPNPVSGNFQIGAFQPQINAYDIYNSGGTLIASKIFDQPEEKIDIYSGDLGQGIYYIRIRTAKGIITRKILKIQN